MEAQNAKFLDPRACDLEPSDLATEVFPYR